MIHKFVFSVILTVGVTLGVTAQTREEARWGKDRMQVLSAPAGSAALFDDGNYGMFIHWGLYSSLAGKWDGKTYYGIGEWIMNPRVAGIPVKEYQKTAAQFNPAEFDARAIARLAKSAGMKWIIITSKHHEGFAMFDSAHPFNIVDATPFKRDPMRELAEACREFDLGFGFYYSHNQDWTAPGGTDGPTTNPDGSTATFEQYFREKCFPQVQEICENYGELNYIWFDTPDGMPEKFVREMAAYVREAQPSAMLCSRIGYGLGDYVSLGDMSVPTKNESGLWETCDTTNDSWSYAWYDNNWKDAKKILGRLVATVARGGTYLLNIGPDGLGRVPKEAAMYLEESGEWIQRYSDVVYGAGSSPWGRALPWGDVTMQDNTLNLVVFDWPRDGRLLLPGLTTQISSANLLVSGKEVPIEWSRTGDWVELTLPHLAAEKLASVVRVELVSDCEVDQTLGVHPNAGSRLMVDFAEVRGAKTEEQRWMEKFGEWVHVNQVSDWETDGEAVWTVDVMEPGFYHLGLNYSGEGRLVWRIETNEGSMIQNQQNSSHVYHEYPMGQIEFKTIGKHTIQVSLVEGDPMKSSLQYLSFIPVN